MKRMIRKKAGRYELVAGKLFRSLAGCQLLVIRRNELEEILKEIHDNSGHQCARYTCNIAKDRYHWPSMYKDIETYVTTCVRCQKNQSSLKSPTTPLKPLPIITKVWYRVGMDLTGPLIESKVNSSNVQILRNKATRCVKRSKVKLYKTPKKDIHALPNKYQRLDSQSDENIIQQEISDEDIMIPSSPFTGPEESTFETNVTRKSREEVLEFINSMKDRIIESIKTNNPLNEFHRELDKRRDFSFKNLLEWSQEHFPPSKIPETRLMTFDTSQEVTEILVQWYLESFEIYVPIYQRRL